METIDKQHNILLTFATIVLSVIVSVLLTLFVTDVEQRSIRRELIRQEKEISKLQLWKKNHLEDEEINEIAIEDRFKCLSAIIAYHSVVLMHRSQVLTIPQEYEPDDLPVYNVAIEE